MKASKNAHKTDGFMEAYSQHLESFRDKPTKLLEIGVQFGGSLETWKKEFPDWDIHGIDIKDEVSPEINRSSFSLHIGDQENPEFLGSFDGYDIIIDDGGHKMGQQRTSFNVLFPKLNHGGLYVIEDLHTSYYPEFWDSEPFMVNVLKEAVDAINSDSVDRQRVHPSTQIDNALSIKSLHFYPSICFIYKK